MTADRLALKKRLHLARVNLDYRRKHATPEIIAQTQAEVDRLAKEWADTKPDPQTTSLRSQFFIGPRQPPRKRGKRGDGPTITCFRCEQVKPRDEFPNKGTVCCECANLQAKEWAAKNPEKRKEVSREWTLRNRNSIKRKWKEDYAANPEKYREAGRRNQAKNRLKRNAWAREYLRRRKKDPKWRALLTCKRRMWILFNGAGIKKNTRSAELMGIDRDGFYAHIESLFQPGMTWENRSKWGWHIDHIIPCAHFDMTDPAQAKACWNFKNLRPLWASDNWRKGDRLLDAP